MNLEYVADSVEKRIAGIQTSVGKVLINAETGQVKTDARFNSNCTYLFWKFYFSILVEYGILPRMSEPNFPSDTPQFATLPIELL